jgi:hypothetical protein
VLPEWWINLRIPREFRLLLKYDLIPQISAAKLKNHQPRLRVVACAQNCYFVRLSYPQIHWDR